MNLFLQSGIPEDQIGQPVGFPECGFVQLQHQPPVFQKVDDLFRRQIAGQRILRHGATTKPSQGTIKAAAPGLVSVTVAGVECRCAPNSISGKLAMRLTNRLLILSGVELPTVSDGAMIRMPNACSFLTNACTTAGL
jgi:hypothetical protein